MSTTEQLDLISETAEAVCAQLFARTHWHWFRMQRGMGTAQQDGIWARDAELTGTWVALKGRFDGQKRKHNRHQTTDD